MSTTDDKPAPHPAPWRWMVGGGEVGVDAPVASLNDADGNYLLPFGPAASPRVRALVAAAPEMEALLREGMKGVDLCHFQNLRRLQGQPIGEPCMTCWACKVLPVLARLDAAKGG